MPQHASSPEPDVVTTLRRCYVSCTRFKFGAEWSSNSPDWCVRHCMVKCLPTWLMTSVSSLKATDVPSSLPLTTCVPCHVRTTASETEVVLLRLSKSVPKPRFLAKPNRTETEVLCLSVGGFENGAALVS